MELNWGCNNEEVSLSLGLAAQEKPAPRITPEQRAMYWRANAEMLAAQAQFNQAKAKLESIESEMTKACGDQQLTTAPDGEPTCQPKAEPTKK